MKQEAEARGGGRGGGGRNAYLLHPIGSSRDRGVTFLYSTKYIRNYWGFFFLYSIKKWIFFTPSRPPLPPVLPIFFPWLNSSCYVALCLCDGYSSQPLVFLLTLKRFFFFGRRVVNVGGKPHPSNVFESVSPIFRSITITLTSWLYLFVWHAVVTGTAGLIYRGASFTTVLYSMSCVVSRALGWSIWLAGYLDLSGSIACLTHFSGGRASFIGSQSRDSALEMDRTSVCCFSGIG